MSESRIRPAVLEPIEVGGLRLRNRAVVAPMTRISAGEAGVPTARMAEYYAAYARGGFGLIVTEGTYTDAAYSRGYVGQPGITGAEQAEGWARVVAAVREAGGRIVLQLMHAGALSQALAETVGPSSVRPKGEMMPDYGGSGLYRTPREMTGDDIAWAIEGFATGAARAAGAGFDGVEVHGANGYLIDQFLTDYTNRRADGYGGDVAGRVRFAAEVVRAVRSAIGDRLVVGIRLSQTKVNDFSYRWPGGRADGEVIFAALRDAGADYLHVASEGRDWAETARIDAEGTTITRLAREISGLPVVANGGMQDPGRAEMVLSEGHADLVSLGRGALANPDWPARLAEGRTMRPFDPAMIHPSPTLEHADRWAAAHPGA